MEMLTCTRCKVGKPKTAEYFPPHNKKVNGFDSWCRGCRATYRNGICRGKFRGAIDDQDLLELKSTVTECVICGNKESLVVDHDHATGKIRGMLCNHCNRGLGHFRDDPQLLEFAMMYLYATADDPRWDSYAASKKTASDPDSRINKSLKAWKC